MFQSARVGCYPAHISYPDLLAAPLLISPRLCMALLEKPAHFLLGLRTPLSGRGYCYRRHKSWRNFLRRVVIHSTI